MGWVDDSNISSDSMSETPLKSNRRRFLADGIRGVFLLLLAYATRWVVRNGKTAKMVWQLDPYKCIHCNRCATACVLEVSAVKCVQENSMCGYCKICTGYFEPAYTHLDSAAENQLCPVGAIQRKALEHPYYEYLIDEPRCIGCAKCVKGCSLFGNGSFFLQVRHDRCLNCNECAIAITCPSHAFKRVPASQSYLFKSREHPG